MESQQPKQVEWYNQWNDRWENYEQITEFLFYDWIHPRTLEDFRAKRVLDAGCGAGRHAQIIAPVAQSVLGIDLNASSVAQAKLQHLSNVTIMEGDIATFHNTDLFEVVYCIGVIHHTQNPEATFKNLSQLCMPGGLLIIWCYSKEGNALIEYGLEPLRRLVLRLPYPVMLGLAYLVTIVLYLAMYTLYQLPLHFLPAYDHIRNLSKLNFKTNVLNVLDKLHAPYTDFISRQRIESWFDPAQFEDVHISPYMGVSWRASAIRKR